MDRITYRCCCLGCTNIAAGDLFLALGWLVGVWGQKQHGPWGRGGGAMYVPACHVVITLLINLRSKLKVIVVFGFIATNKSSIRIVLVQFSSLCTIRIVGAMVCCVVSAAGTQFSNTNEKYY